jgi:hypothetical protein
VRKRLLVSLAVAAVAAVSIVPSATSDTSGAQTAQRQIMVRLGDFVVPQGLQIGCRYTRFSDGKQLVCTHRNPNKTIFVSMLNGRLVVYDGDSQIYTHGW